jgi:hypothetical protein
MRVYTDDGTRKLISYLKLGLGVAVLFLVLTQAVKLWNNDPALQELRNLLQTEQTAP